MIVLRYNVYFLMFINIFLGYVTTTSLVPKVLKLGKNFGFIDIPNYRKKHNSSKVRIGGLSMLVSYIIVLFLNYFFDTFQIVNDKGFNTFLTIILVTILFFILGLIDDIYNLSPYFRLGMQLVASSFIWFQGIRIDLLNINWMNSNISVIDLPDILSFLITVIWLAGITNAINWIDGLDGLATSISIASFFGILFISFNLNNQMPILIGSIILGNCLGFLPYNKNPSKIMMGDCGSYYLGFNLACISLLATNVFSQTNNKLENIPQGIYILFLIFLIPISDMVIVIFQRIKNGKSPFYPDRSHLHHRLIDNFFIENDVVYILFSSAHFFVSMGAFLFSISLSTFLWLISSSILLIYVLKNSLKNRNKKMI